MPLDADFSDAPQPTSNAPPPVPGMDPATAPEPALAIQTFGLSKHYRSHWTRRLTHGLIDLDLAVGRGEVFGYLGPNGAGKTTTIKLLCGLLRQSRGRGWLLGEPIGSAASRRRLGFLPEQPYFYDSLTGPEYLELAARLSGVPAHEATLRARQWVGRVGLDGRERLRMRKYSKGMLQRLGLAAALIHEPELLILDEPMSGLDPFGRRDVRDLVLEQKARGVTVMLSSHILPDVESLCDRVGVVLDGRLVRCATVREMVGFGRSRIEIRCVGTPLVEIPKPWQARIERAEMPEGTVFTLLGAEVLDEVVSWLLQSGARLASVTPQRATLEEFFLSVAAEARDAAPPQSAPRVAAHDRRSA